MVYGTYNYSIHGLYKPSNITGGPHIVLIVYINFQNHQPAMIFPLYPHLLLGIFPWYSHR